MSAPVSLAGFPTDRQPFGEYSAHGTLLSVTAPIFEHQVDSSDGQSGAPVCVVRGGLSQAIGIHLGDGTSGADGAQRNRALALTPEIVSWLQDH